MQKGPNTSHLAATALLLALIWAAAQSAVAQEFRVGSFRELPNDVSAFITPVRDLNGDACALVKVAAQADFAFSSPLGIVKRHDEVGEVWLYLPRRSRLLTIKHPEWGVLRDYRFPRPLESHVTYELVIEPPRRDSAALRDTVVITKTVIDTVAVGRSRPKLPLRADVMLTAAFHSHGPSWGIMLALMRRHGAYIHAETDFCRIGDTRMDCAEDGSTADGGPIPYYTGQTRHANYAVTAGPIHRIGSRLSLFYGVGYGRAATAWQLAASEGGGYALNTGLTHKGIAAEAGLALRLGRISVAASAITIEGKQWQGSVGIGVNLFKGKKVKR